MRGFGYGKEGFLRRAFIALLVVSTKDAGDNAFNKTGLAFRRPDSGVNAFSGEVFYSWLLRTWSSLCALCLVRPWLRRRYKLITNLGSGQLFAEL